MSILKRARKVHIILFLILIASIFSLHMVQAVMAEPGTNEDPLVSQSYVDAKMSELNAKINDLISKNNEQNIRMDEQKAAINSLNQQLQNMQYPKFEVIEVEAGKQLIAGASTELILRGGEATAIASVEGGVSNLISGKDIKTGEKVPFDQLLLIPRDDGRGLKFTKKSWVLIKGSYTIK